MDPNIKIPNQSNIQPSQRDADQDDAYAQSLLHMVEMQDKLKTDAAPKKRFLSKKKLIFIVVSIVLTILSLLLTPALLKSGKNTDSNDKAQQFINSAAGVSE